MRKIKKVDVKIDERHVGILTEYEGRIAFQYSSSWLDDGFSLNPFSLPLKNELFIPKDYEFDGLFGVFDDCLPDGWGHFLTDRYLQTKGISKEGINALTWLCILNSSSSGCLEYSPRIEASDEIKQEDFDELFRTARKIIREIPVQEEEIEKLYRKGGSLGGARPKVSVIIDDEPWIVKFPSSFDGDDAGENEFECNEKAIDAGLDVAPFRLVKSSLTKGFFASKRFDRINGKRIHMVSLSGLLESSPRYPALDYYHLLKVTAILTQSEKEVEEAFRRACFNVFLENQDDHGRNFAFLYDEERRKWHLSPAYDLTVSHTSFGEHSTTVMKKGKDIKDDDLRMLADEFAIKERKRDEIIRDTKNAVKK